MKRMRWSASGGRGLPVEGSIVSMILSRVVLFLGWEISFYVIITRDVNQLRQTKPFLGVEFAMFVFIYQSRRKS